MAKPSLPSPYERFVDDEGKISDLWYRYLSQALTQANDLTDVVGGLSTGTTGLTAVAFSSFALQADQEAGASTFSVVTPSVQQYHPSAAKAWAHVTLAGTVATVTTGYNVNSAESTATGLLKVNLTNSFSSTNYVVNGMVRISDSTTNNHSVTHPSSIALDTTTFTLLCQAADGTNTAPAAWYVICYGDQ